MTPEERAARIDCVPVGMPPPDPEEWNDKIRSEIAQAIKDAVHDDRSAHGDAKEHQDRLVLAASRGVFVALRTTWPLGLAAKSFGYRERSFEGDAFETAFEWAREEARE